MIDALDIMALETARDRRSGIDRRVSVSGSYYPERRKNGERRNGIDRRKRNPTAHKAPTNQAATSSRS